MQNKIKKTAALALTIIMCLLFSAIDVKPVFASGNSVYLGLDVTKDT